MKRVKSARQDGRHAAEYIGQQRQPKIYFAALRKLRAVAQALGKIGALKKTMRRFIKTNERILVMNQISSRSLFIVKLGMVVFSLVLSLNATEIPVAILDFGNLTNDSEYDYLCNAVPELLLTDLSTCKEIQLIERKKLEQILKEHSLGMTGAIDSASVAKAGKLVGAKAIILGTILKAGNSFRIDCRMTDVSTGKISLAEKVEWNSEDDLIASVDDLARRVAKRLVGKDVEIASVDSLPNAPTYGQNVLAMEVALDNEYMANGSNKPVYLQIDLFSQEIEQEKRLPLNVSIVIDRSGSMASQRKFDFVQEAATYVVGALESSDIISVVTYDTDVDVPVPANLLTNKARVIDLVKKLSPGGNTFLSGGMEEGYKQSKSKYATGQINRVLLLSDGMANKGIQDAISLGNICKKWSDAGISISTFGVGLDYNEDLMMALSEYGNGNYYFIDSPNRIPTLFAKELKGLLSVTAQNVVIELDLMKDVKLGEVVGYESRLDGSKVIVQIGDMISGEHRSIVARLSVPSSGKDSLRVAKARVSYQDAIAKTPGSLEFAGCVLRYTADNNLVATNVNSHVAQNANYMQSNLNVQNAAQMVTKGELKEARELLAKEAQSVQRAAAEYQTTSLKKQVLSVYKYKESLEGFEERQAEEQKMIQKRSKFSSYEKLKSKK